MAVGKGSLNRVVAKTKKSEIVTLLPNNVVDIEVSSIKFKAEKNNELMDKSVKAYGVILPVIVEETTDGLKLIDGAKRLTALEKLGVKTVKAVVLKEGGSVLSELKKFEKPVQVVENEVVKKPAKAKKQTIHEEKFNVIKRLGEEEMPYYLL